MQMFDNFSKMFDVVQILDMHVIAHPEYHGSVKIGVKPFFLPKNIQTAARIPDTSCYL